MKYRTDYVTNSSSSSFICVAKINLADELRAYMKEEFGKFGERLLNEMLETGAEIKDAKYHPITDNLDEEFVEELEDDAYYLTASFIEWANDGDTEGNDAFLYRNIPDKYMTELYNGGN